MWSKLAPFLDSGVGKRDGSLGNLLAMTSLDRPRQDWSGVSTTDDTSGRLHPAKPSPKGNRPDAAAAAAAAAHLRSDGQSGRWPNFFSLVPYDRDSASA